MGKIEQAMKALRSGRSRDPSTREIADALGWSMAKTRRELWKLVAQGHVSAIYDRPVALWRLEADTPRGKI